MAFDETMGALYREGDETFGPDPHTAESVEHGWLDSICPLVA